VTDSRTDRPAIERAARDALGVQTLREGQGPAIEALMQRRDVVAVMPTGSGKSAIFQVAGTLIDGPTLVISPLLALQHDQVRSIERLDAGGAAAVNGDQPAGRRRDAMDAWRDGDTEFLFLAPEQLTRPSVLDRVRRAAPSLVVVDEAHCVSSWGHDFRPDYLLLADVLDELNHPPTVALTATAAPPVRRHVVERLGLRDAATVVTGLDRPNIELHVHRVAAELDKMAVVERILSDAPGRHLVYVTTRRRTHEVAELLADGPRRAEAYHSGMASGPRRRVHEGFAAGDVDVVVATSAFGMGIDIAEVRGVIHWDAPDSLDEYSQEIGRAGRDGAPSTAHLLFRPEDLHRRSAITSRRAVSEATVQRIVDELGQAGGDPSDVRSLVERTGLHRRTVTAALVRLRDVAAVEMSARGPVRPLRLEGAVDRVAADDRERRTWRTSRAALLREYAETSRCRRQVLLGYFGQAVDPCGQGCDNCRRSGGSGRLTQQAGVPPWLQPSAGVQHVAWGRGQVVHADGDSTTVWFEHEGYRRLSTDLVLERALLTPASGPR
jgi:ATP-dependent DNA helicase RecQ